MLKNKWLYAGLFIFLFPFFLLINLNDNASEIANQKNNLEDVSNAEMEKVIELNPDIFPMRIALANRYFEEFLEKFLNRPMEKHMELWDASHGKIRPMECPMEKF